MILPMPHIVYLQTYTACNGHCRYCPFDDIYGGREPYGMSMDNYATIIEWLRARWYDGRIGFLLHYEPTLDPDLLEWVEYARAGLPDAKLEVATNGTVKHPALKEFDVVDCIPAGSRITATSRAGNVRACPEIAGRHRLINPPCIIPEQTMPIAANGDVLLCCQDWRHEAVVGTVDNLTEARANQLRYAKGARNIEFEICKDCMAGRTAEEVGERLGKRTL